MKTRKMRQCIRILRRKRQIYGSLAVAEGAIIYRVMKRHVQRFANESREDKTALMNAVKRLVTWEISEARTIVSLELQDYIKATNER